MPEFFEKKLELISKKMQSLCDMGFYNDMAWEVGTSCSGKRKIIFKDFLGKSDVRASEDSIWRIFSMTKPIVTIAALKLIEEGKLRLFDHVSRFLPKFKNPKILKIINNNEKFFDAYSPMTIFHLLTHTSGLSYGFLPDNIASIYRSKEILLHSSVSLKDEVENISCCPLLFEPGSKWNYSVSTDILAYIIECAADMELEDVLKSYLFKKIGIKDISFKIDESKILNLMTCYGDVDIFSKDLAIRNTDIFSNNPSLKEVNLYNTYPTNDSKFRRGGHGLFSTLDAYSTFAFFLLQKSNLILSRKSFELMLTDHTKSEMKPLGINNIFKPSPGLDGDGFGLGFRIRGSGSGSLLFGSVGEFGWAGAAETMFFVDPIEEFYVVFMAQNLDQPGASALFKQMVYSALI